MKSIFRLKKSVVSSQWSVVSPAASRQGGYTIIEMLTVLAIIALLSTVILTNYTKNRQSEILLNETYKISQLIRRAQNLALSPQYGGGSRNGFGVRLNTTTSGGTVILFADNLFSGNLNQYDAAEDKERLDLNSQVKISSIIPASPLDVVYIPPDPETRITGGATTATIKIESINDPNKYRTIEVNATGLVEVK